VIAGNPASLSEGEYVRRHAQLLSSMLTSSTTSSLDMHTAPYSIGSCSFTSAMEQEPAREHKTILMAQVAPPRFLYRRQPVRVWISYQQRYVSLAQCAKLGILGQRTRRRTGEHSWLSGSSQPIGILLFHLSFGR
jgi:hypothetical protein